MKGLFFVFVLFLVLAPLGLDAGVPPPPPTTGNPGCWPPPCIPIDGGIGLLILAGAALGAKKVYGATRNSGTSV